MRDPYFMLFYEMIMAVAAYHAATPRVDPCDFVFDEHGKIGRRALVWWDNFKQAAKSASGTDFTPYLGSPPIFRPDESYLPLQAADLWAWHLRRRLGRGLIIPEQPAEFVLMPINSFGRKFTDYELADIRDTMIQISERIIATNPDLRMMKTGSRRKKP